MSKYDFIQIGEKVKFDMFGDDNFKIMQVCTPVHAPISEDTTVNLIAVDESENIDANSYMVRVGELLPVLSDFNQGYWCALQDAASNGASDSVIREMLCGAGFSFWETYWHMKQSGFQSDRIKPIVQELFCKQPQYIEWRGKEYPTKSIVIREGTSDEEVVIVSVECLAYQLLDDDGVCLNPEAQAIDTQICFYLDEETFNLPDEDIAAYLEGEIE